MAYTTIKKPSDYFNTKLYTGNGSTQSITGVGFQPDMTWIKSRTTGGGGNNNHCINDIVRAKGSFGYPMIHPNLTASEYDPASGNEVITDFQSDGFSLGGNENSNYNTATYASWNWLADNTSGSANTDGSINSTVSANTTSGFSIVSYTGTGANATVGHGLGSALACYVVKSRDSAYDWRMYHQGIGATKYLNLNQTIAEVTASNAWNNTAPTSSVFSLGSGSTVNQSSDNFIAYCFAEKQGFSKFGSYTGNGSADGTFVYTGFKPAFVILKRTDSSGFQWVLSDGVRDPDNAVEKYVHPSTSDPEASGSRDIDFLSNGFKIRNSNTTWNASGGSYIYMAFAEQPLVGDNPATAR